MSTEMAERIAAALAEFSGTTRFLAFTIGVCVHRVCKR